MPNELIISSHFDHMYNKLLKNSQWNAVLVAVNSNHKTVLEVILQWLISNQPIPSQYCPHKVHVNRKTQRILRQFKTYYHVSNIKTIELHLNGKSGDQLLLYGKLNHKVILITIGSHDDIF